MPEPVRVEHLLTDALEEMIAIMLLSQGRNLPTTLASMSLRERAQAVLAIDSFVPLPDLVFKVFLTRPEQAEQAAASSPQMAEILDQLKARTIIAAATGPLGRRGADARRWERLR